jgi:hypothetical protein
MDNKAWSTVLLTTGLTALSLLLIITIATHRIPRSFVSMILLVGGVAGLTAAWYKREQSKEEEGEDV